MPPYNLTTHPPDQPLPWSEGFAVGIAFLDEEHQAMLTACNHLCAMVRRGAAGHDLRVLSAELVATAEAHFASEERLFPRTRLPWVAHHLAEHEQIRRSLGKALLLSTPAPELATTLHAVRTMLMEHVLGQDMHFRDWAKGTT